MANPNDPNLPKMTESLSVGGLEVASDAPAEAQSWVGSWRPGLMDPNGDDLTVTDTVTFTSEGMYNPFMTSRDVAGKSTWVPGSTANTAIAQFN
jgi:hypothetical protein